MILQKFLRFIYRPVCLQNYFFLPFLLIQSSCCFVMCSAILSGRISKVREVLTCPVAIRHISPEGNRFYEYPSLNDGMSRLVEAVKLWIYQLHKDPLRTRRRVKYRVYEDMWNYIGGARRLPGLCQFSLYVY